MKRLIAKGNKKAPKQRNGFYFFLPFSKYDEFDIVPTTLYEWNSVPEKFTLA